MGSQRTSGTSCLGRSLLSCDIPTHTPANKSSTNFPLYPFFQQTANLPTNVVDFRGFDSSTTLILRGEILMSIGSFPESSSQAMIVGVMLVGRLGVCLFITTGLNTGMTIKPNLTCLNQWLKLNKWGGPYGI